jgi:hypothetical protein
MKKRKKEKNLKTDRNDGASEKWEKKGKKVETFATGMPGTWVALSTSPGTVGLIHFYHCSTLI